MRTIHKLSDAAARAETKPGRLSDGSGLYLRIAAGGSKTWAFLFTWDRRRTEMSLGSYPAVSLAKARQRAKQCREMLADNINPKAERDRESEPTFSEAVAAYLAINAASWSDGYRKQWSRTLGPKYCRSIQGKRVSLIGDTDIQKILTPIWNEVPLTASNIRARIEAVLDFCRVQGWRHTENPARWRGHLSAIFPKQRRRVTHHKALEYERMPEFFADLAAIPTMSSMALRFQILTAARPSEAVGASWSEIDMDRALWVIPPERMKRGRPHTVPLSEPAMAILRPLFDAKLSPFVFPGRKPKAPLSRRSPHKLLLRRMGSDVSAHGMRSTFRDFSGDLTNFPREVAEGALAHLVGNDTERSYRRREGIEKRRQLLETWGDFCTGQRSASVIPIAGGRIG